jgi:hypothetical protein
MPDINDFSQDVSIHGNNASNPAVDTINDGTYERLAVDVLGTVAIDYDESPTKYQLKTNYNATGTSVPSSPDTTLYTYTGQGVLDLVAVNCLTSANWGVVIVIDGTERLRISMPDLGSNLGLTNSDFAIVTETANKQFRWKPDQIGFTTSFTIKAYATGTTVTLNHLILFRERVT